MMSGPIDVSIQSMNSQLYDEKKSAYNVIVVSARILTTTFVVLRACFHQETWILKGVFETVNTFIVY